MLLYQGNILGARRVRGGCEESTSDIVVLLLISCLGPLLAGNGLFPAWDENTDERKMLDTGIGIGTPKSFVTRVVRSLFIAPFQLVHILFNKVHFSCNKI